MVETTVSPDAKIVLVVRASIKDFLFTPKRLAASSTWEVSEISVASKLSGENFEEKHDHMMFHVTMYVEETEIEICLNLLMTAALVLIFPKCSKAART